MDGEARRGLLKAPNTSVSVVLVRPLRPGIPQHGGMAYSSSLPNPMLTFIRIPIHETTNPTHYAMND